MVSEQDCIFCKLVRGEIPSKKVYEDSDIIAFLDINPANLGHCLIIPKKHSETIFDTDDKVLQKLIIVTKKLATAVKEKLNADGVNVMQNNGQHAGQLVAHVHFHVIPRFPDDKVVISYQRAQVDENALNEIQKKLTGNVVEERREEKVPEKPKEPKKNDDWELEF